MIIDKYKLKVSRYVIELDGEIDRNQRIDVTSEMEIYDLSNPDNQDGSFDQVYYTKCVGKSSIAQGERVIRGKDKSKQSKITRGAIMALQDEVEKLDVDKEIFYQEMQKAIRRHLPTIYEMVKSELSFNQ